MFRRIFSRFKSARQTKRTGLSSKRGLIRQPAGRGLFYEPLEERSLLSADLSFANSIGGTDNQSVRYATTDSAGNLYISGHYYGTVDFDPGPSSSSLTAAGSPNSYVGKYDAAGNLLWVISLDGPFSGASGIKVDSSGNVYAVGTFSGTVDFDPGLAVDSRTSLGQSDVYVLSLDSAGNYRWSTQVGGAGIDNAYDLELSPNSDVTISGDFQGSVDFDPGPAVANATAHGGNADGFILRLTSAGNYRWSRTYGNFFDHLRIGAIHVDQAGSVFAAGTLGGTVDFNPGPAVNNVTNSSFFVLKLTDPGNFAWVQGLGSSATIAPTELVVDSSGQIVLTGYFTGTADFDPGPVDHSLTSNNASSDGFVVKLTAAGKYVWAEALSGPGNDQAIGLALDPADNIYVAGSFRDSFDSDPGASTSLLVSAGAADGFVVSLDRDGKYLWSKAQGGVGDDIAFGLTLDANQNLFVAGSFQATAVMDSTASSPTTVTSLGASDVYLCKFSQKFDFLGTSGVDVATVTVRNKYIDVTINGQLSHVPIPTSVVRTISINTLGNIDTINVFGGSQDEVAKLRSTSLELSGLGYLVKANLVENKTIRGGGGTNTVYLYDSSGDDQFVARPTLVQMVGTGFNNNALGFQVISATASLGGFDKSTIYDTAGDDNYYARPTYVQMVANNYSVRAAGFDQTFAYTSSGFDTAYMYDSAGDDNFYGRSSLARLSGVGFSNQVSGFDRVYAIANAGGTDRRDARNLLYALISSGTWEIIV